MTKKLIKETKESLEKLAKENPKAALDLAANITQEVADGIESEALTIIAVQLSKEARRLK